MKFKTMLASASIKLVAASAALGIGLAPAQASSCCINSVITCQPTTILMTHCGDISVYGNCTSPDSFVRRVCGQTTGQIGVNYYMAQCNYQCSYIDCNGEPEVQNIRINTQEAAAYGSPC